MNRPRVLIQTSVIACIVARLCIHTVLLNPTVSTWSLKSETYISTAFKLIRLLHHGEQDYRLMLMGHNYTASDMFMLGIGRDKATT